MNNAHYKIRFRHPDVPDKFLVIVTELKPEHRRRIEKLVDRHHITLEAGMEIAAVMNVVMQQPDLIPIDVIRISVEQYNAFTYRRGEWVQ